MISIQSRTHQEVLIMLTQKCEGEVSYQSRLISNTRRECPETSPEIFEALSSEIHRATTTWPFQRRLEEELFHEIRITVSNVLKEHRVELPRANSGNPHPSKNPVQRSKTRLPGKIQSFTIRNLFGQIYCSNIRSNRSASISCSLF